MKRMVSVEALSSVHIVGVAGSATSGLARILGSRGITVTGSDRTRAGLLDDDASNGDASNGDASNPVAPNSDVSEESPEGAPPPIRVHAGHAPTNVADDVELVVHSAAIPADNPELCAARERGIPIKKYAEFLGDLMREQRGLAVAGTHGKTSTAGMVASILMAAGRDPSVLIGGVHPHLRGNWRQGRGGDFLAEACEFDRSFLALFPEFAVVTNLELDHPDVYASESDLTEAFQAFVDRIPATGHLIVNGDDPGASTLHASSGCRRVTFGFGAGCDYRAVEVNDGARPTFEIHCERYPAQAIVLRVPGVHNVSNALAAVALAAELGVEPRYWRAGLAAFPGIERRFQPRGTVAGVTLIDDYAHHPTEVARALEAARAVYPNHKIRAVFEPHQFTRLRAFAPAFAAALANADAVDVLPVFSVREALPPDPRRPAEHLVEMVEAHGVSAVSYESIATAAELRVNTPREGDEAWVVLGAGVAPSFTTAALAALWGPTGAGEESEKSS